MVKLGDYTYYKYQGRDNLVVGSGLIIGICEEYVSILEIESYRKSIIRIQNQYLVPVKNRDDLIAEINEFYDKKIKEQESQLKSVSRSDYAEDIKKEYALLKEEILNTCANMTKDIDDYDFENKIKAICHKKKQLFSIKCDEMNKARKFNGEIKYNIREIRNKRDSILRNLDYSINQIKKVI